jgi:hypothetical protein
VADVEFYDDKVPAATKGAPGPLELSRMHEAELKRCFVQIQTVARLINQIMVGRKIKVPSWDYPIEVVEVKIINGKPCPFGRRKGRKTVELLEQGFDKVEIVP